MTPKRTRSSLPAPAERARSSVPPGRSSAPPRGGTTPPVDERAAGDDPPSDRPSSAFPRGAPATLDPPAQLSAHTFRVGPDEFAVLSYPLAALEPPAELTTAERHVVAALLRGKSNGDIAAERGTSPRTIANQVAAVFRKLGVRSRAELAARCARRSRP